MRWLALVAAALLIAACSDVKNVGVGLRERVETWLLPEEAPQREESPLYCYGTIGEEDCYAAPQPGAERRLIQYVGPPPRPEP